MANWDVSHIALRSSYNFNGFDYVTIAHSTTLNITGNFSISWMQKADKSYSTYAIFSKGHPTNPSTGSFYLESVNGFLHVFLHDSSQNKSLVYITLDPILRDVKPTQIEVTWDNTLKDLIVYKNASPVGLILDISSPSYFTSNTQFSALTTNTSPIEFGRATGKPSFVGKTYDFYITKVTRTPIEVYQHYQITKDSSVIITDTIAFSTDRLSSTKYDLYEMTQYGTTPSLLYTSTKNILFPKYNNNGTKLMVGETPDTVLLTYFFNNGFDVTANSGGNQPANYTVLDNTGGVLNTASVGVGYYVSHLHSNLDDTWFYASSGTGANSFLNYVWDTSFGAFNASQNSTAYPTSFAINPVDKTKGVMISAGYTLYSCTINNQFITLGSLMFASGVTTAHTLAWVKYSWLGNYIGFSKRNSATTTAKWEMWIMTSTGGSPTRLYGLGSNYHNIFYSFSPDETKVLFGSNKTGTWQIYVCNLDGSEIENLSQNSYNDQFAEWKLQP